MGKKRVTIIGDFDTEEKLRQQKAIERQQKKLREGKKISKSEAQAAELAKQSAKTIDIDKIDQEDPFTAMRLEMARLKQEKEKSSNTDTSIKQKSTSKKVTHPRSAKYISKKSQNLRTTSHTSENALNQILKLTYSKFTSSVELHINLRKRDSFSSTTINLPHQAGKSKKVVALTPEIISELENKKITFDVLFATPDQMKDLVKFAKLLGPKGLMPNPKNGTVVPNAESAISNFKSTSITIKTEPKAPIVHTVIGKTNMTTTQLLENLTTILKSIDSKNIKSAYIATTMSPVVKLDIGKQN